MKGRRKSRDVCDESKLEMTPMIDVTFLLLVFFLCTIRFKVLEGKIPAYLPKNEGVSPTPIEDQLERLEIEVVRTERAPTFEELRDGLRWEWEPSQISVSVGGKRMESLAAFGDRVRDYVLADPEPKAKLRLVATGERAAIYADAVAVVDVCLAMGLTSIVFEGEPPSD